MGAVTLWSVLPGALQPVLLIALLWSVGFLLGTFPRGKPVLDDGFVKKLSRLTTEVLLPALSFLSLSASFSVEKVSTLWPLVVWGAFQLSLSFCLGQLAVLTLKIAARRWNLPSLPPPVLALIPMVCTWHNATGFPVPVAQALCDFLDDPEECAEEMNGYSFMYTLMWRITICLAEIEMTRCSSGPTASTAVSPSSRDPAVPLSSENSQASTPSQQPKKTTKKASPKQRRRKAMRFRSPDGHNKDHKLATMRNKSFHVRRGSDGTKTPLLSDAEKGLPRSAVSERLVKNMPAFEALSRHNRARCGSAQSDCGAEGEGASPSAEGGANGGREREGSRASTREGSESDSRVTEAGRGLKAWAAVKKWWSQVCRCVAWVWGMMGPLTNPMMMSTWLGILFGLWPAFKTQLYGDTGRFKVLGKALEFYGEPATCVSVLVMGASLAHSFRDRHSPRSSDTSSSFSNFPWHALIALLAVKIILIPSAAILSFYTLDHLAGLTYPAALETPHLDIRPTAASAPHVHTPAPLPPHTRSIFSVLPPSTYVRLIVLIEFCSPPANTHVVMARKVGFNPSGVYLWLVPFTLLPLLTVTAFFHWCYASGP
ncbi:unnamed protein product [Vitrella brassicaformis CCMP3155]|uniref:Uncharacterized protein n=2 Tax=Vitrella brassicaformis TaxID=1169539 RepID=A0A0G4H4K7_VITBC|nr:unnamed protein product [Vitrella brassicaformis CCMP3155]|eukprot:CEM38590.1 unnamed protein product [Vitrella brassicaformis CCMP3155]